jgi:hypothetical protein
VKASIATTWVADQEAASSFLASSLLVLRKQAAPVGMFRSDSLDLPPKDHGRFSFLAARNPADAVSFSQMYAPLFVVP